MSIDEDNSNLTILSNRLSRKTWKCWDEDNSNLTILSNQTGGEVIVETDEDNSNLTILSNYMPTDTIERKMKIIQI